MRTIEIDASRWNTALDFIRALQSALSAPEWCGSNVDALMELMVWGLGAGEFAPPYVVRISGADKAPQEVRDHIALIVDHVRRARAEKVARDGEDVDVTISY